MKGLLLSYQAGMWDSVVTGVKTNTRRCHKTLQEINQQPDNFELIGSCDKDGLHHARFKPKDGGIIIECRARYQVGEVVFLQEPTMNLNPHVTKEDMIMYQYRDKEGHTELHAFKMLIETAQANGAHWSNKMFMPCNQARYFIKIRRIEIERLQDISERDCLAEGIKMTTAGYSFAINGKTETFATAKKAYFALYNSINRNSPQNPWVFSYHFELCTANG